MFTQNTKVEDAVIDTLAYKGPCTIDVVIASLSTYDWSEILSAVGATLRDGRLLLQGNSDSGYRLSLSPSPSVKIQMHTKLGSVPFCMGCGYVCDEIDPDAAQSPWVDAHHYLTKYGGTWTELHRNEGFCPTCARLSTYARRGAVFAHP